MTLYNFTCTGIYGNGYKFTVAIFEENVRDIARHLFRAFNHVEIENAETGEIVYDRYENSDIFVAEAFNYNTISDVISEIGLDNVYRYEVTVR
jgi:hypothetical protein